MVSYFQGEGGVTSLDVSIGRFPEIANYGISKKVFGTSSLVSISICQALENLRLIEQVRNYLHAIGWDLYWNFNSAAFVEFTHATFSFDIPEKFDSDTPKLVT